jgi:hypothetical protein
MDNKELDFDENKTLADEYSDYDDDGDSDEPLSRHSPRPLATRVLIYLYWIVLHITLAVLVFALVSQSSSDFESPSDARVQREGTTWCESGLAFSFSPSFSQYNSAGTRHHRV